MSDTPSDTVSLDKPADSAGSGGSRAAARAPGAGGSVAPPKTINIMGALMGLMIVANIAQALLLLGNTDMLKRYVLHSNATAKNPQDPFDAVHAVYSLRQSSFFTAALFGVLILLLAFALRRQRSASASRWAVLVIFLYTMMPLSIIPTHGLPAPVQVVQVINGLASIAVLVLIFLPVQSRSYFARCRAANAPNGAPARPGLSSLFAPRGAATVRATTARAAGGRTASGRTGTGTRSAQTPTKPAQTRPVSADARPGGKARAKVRADSEAIAKGADLARSRARASKSRRTE